MSKLYGVIGHPVSHSLSPLMHEVAYSAWGLKDTKYSLFPILPQDLGAFIKRLRQGEITGVNVTVPHKEAVIDYLDELFDSSILCGAVNTIVREGNRLIGHNTDIGGFSSSLIESGVVLMGSRVLVLGAGGASRAVVASVMSMGATEVIISNRSAKRAEDLVVNFSKYYPGKLRTAEWDEKSLTEVARDRSLIINTTTLGMVPSIETSPPLDLTIVNKKAVVTDVVYRPLETSFLRQARACGLATVSGDGMLVHQAARSLKLWFDRDPGISLMHEALIKGLNHVE